MKLNHILENRANQVKSYDRELGKIMLDVKKYGTGTEYFYQGKLHRNDGKPAAVWKGWSTVLNYYYRGNLHNEDGPAIIDDGKEEWYLDGIKYTEEQWKDELGKK